jgi:hypothetical protein
MTGTWTYSHTCFDLHNTTGQTTDAGLPPGGQAFYYVVTQKNSDYCESIPGYACEGSTNPCGLDPEPNPRPCP